MVKWERQNVFPKIAKIFYPNLQLLYDPLHGHDSSEHGDVSLPQFGVQTTVNPLQLQAAPGQSPKGLARPPFTSSKVIG